MFIHRWVDKITGIPREITWFIQRGRRGWADCDTWSFDSYLCKVISGGTRYLATHVHGCPHELYKDDNCAKWDKILIEIAEGFEANLKIQNDEVLDYSESDKLYDNEKLLDQNSKWSKKFMEIRNSPKSKKLIKEHEVKFDRAIKLFHKYFNNLWD